MSKQMTDVELIAYAKKVRDREKTYTARQNARVQIAFALCDKHKLVITPDMIDRVIDKIDNAGMTTASAARLIASK